MCRSAILVLLTLLATAPTVAQEVDEAPAVDESAAAEGDDATAVEEDGGFDDADLDQQTYEEDEDVFVPTEEIPADEPIPFPTNI